MGDEVRIRTVARSLRIAVRAARQDARAFRDDLACADAGEGKAAAAKEHLQMAFDRRANGIDTEHFPDPTQDDSLQKLKSDRTFWLLATSISAQLKQSK